MMESVCEQLEARSRVTVLDCVCVKTQITFHPVCVCELWCVCVRSDIPDCAEIKADIDHVVDISRCVC